MHLSDQEKKELFEALFYCNVKELKALCLRFKLPIKGEKIVLIENIKHFINTGTIPAIKQMPAISKAKPKTNYPLDPETLILYGSFKNDLKTRIFFKSLIGTHFHYTAYGIDWIKEKWFQGNPPTYGEFAQYWQKEFSARQQTKGKLKQEWAYLNFLDRYSIEHPNATKSNTIEAWQAYREKQVALANMLINKNKHAP